MCEIEQSVNRNLLDSYSPLKIGNILPTSTKPKQDVFVSFRPDPHKCVDYAISQTYATFQARDTTINVAQTTGTYVPITEEQLKEVLRREKEQKIVYTSGRRAQWKFIDEIWREKQNKLQEQYKKELHTFIKRRKRIKGKSSSKEHSHILNLVGPEWYQELSPKQIRIVDQLKLCIFKDLRDNTIVHTQENIAGLGLVLRPNKYHIQKALRHSSGDPVEFLLILYQLINPDRITYSLNDRLLLSAVVHLTITETLREMHVTLPSPPRRVIIMNTPEITPKKIEYESPYLEPLTVTPVPQKYTGIYTNKHIQYPESPYFSYLNYFRENCFVGDIGELIYSDDLTLKEKVVLLEYQKAQKFYDSLAGNKTMKELLKPTILNINEIDDLEEYDNKVFSRVPSLAKLRHPDYEVCTCECGKLYPIYPDTQITKPYSCGCEPKKNVCTCMEYAEKFYQSICRCKKCAERRDEANVICVISGVRDAATCDNILPVINGIAMVKPCDCFEKFRDRVVRAQGIQNLLSTKEKYVVQGLSLTNAGPVYHLSSMFYERKFCPLISEQYQETLARAQETLSGSERKHVIGGIVHTINGPVYILSTIYKERGDRCDCFDLYKYKITVKKIQKQLQESEVKHVVGGLTNTRDGPVYIISNVASSSNKNSEENPGQICKPTCKHKLKENICCLVGHSSSTTSSDASVTTTSTSNIESTSSSETSTCPCTNKTSSSTEMDYPSTTVICEKPSLRGDPIKPITIAKEEEPSTTKTCTGCPTVSMPDEKSKTAHEKEENATDIENTDSNVEKSKTCSCIKKEDKPRCGLKKQEVSEERCRCLEVNGEKEETAVSEADEESDENFCRCKEELDIFLENQCNCDLCNEERRQKEATYIMSGGMTTESGHFLRVLEGIRQKQCGCLHDHQEKIRKMEEYKRRLKARLKMMKRKTKYTIGGIQNTPEGPCYLISGIRPPVDCDCAKALRAKEAEEARQAQMAKMPDTGRFKYEIAGVREMPGEENIYILNRALRVEECECMRILKQYEHEHKVCLEEFNKFIDHLKNETQMYLNEEKEETTLLETNFDTSAYEIRNADTDVKNDNNEPGNVKQKYEEKEEKEIPEPEDDKEECSCSQDDESDTSEVSESSSHSSSEEASLCSKCRSETSNSSGSSVTSKASDGHCGCILCKPIRDTCPIKPITIPPPKTPVDFESKRFFIYHKLPVSYKKQKNIIKKLLKSMADDGYSLPKLPDCHKLPHFRLWMQMRVGVSWNQSDRWKYARESKALWNHTDICYRMVEQPSLPISRKKGSQLTWRDARYVKTMLQEHHETFYRKVKQVTIDSAREFFPPTFSYEFPTKGFRDCYFAYLPAKEEEVFAYHVPIRAEPIPEAAKYQCYC